MNLRGEADEFPMIGEDGKPSVTVPWYVGEALYKLYSEIYGNYIHDYLDA